MLIPAVVLLLTAAQVPDSQRGSNLFHDCQAAVRAKDQSRVSDDDLASARTCAAYIDGFTDGIAVLDRKVVCVDEGAAMETLIRVYVSYMVKNPKMMDNFKARPLRSA